MMTVINPEHVGVSNTCETPEQRLQYKEIIRCIRQLSPAYKLAFNLFVIEGLSHAEIAYKLHISEGTSKSNLSKARHQLQQLLKNYNIMSYG
jgi:RNA polymerase sigma-70 factor (ECF subfamily)